MTTHTEHLFDTRDAAVHAATEFITQQLTARLDQGEHASLVVSGGSTPKPCFEQLAQLPLDWGRITVLLSDERWVAPDHPDSNEQMVRESLLQSHAAAATLIPYFRPDHSIEQACERVGEHIRGVSQPFSCTLLGMGEDGHFASLFPDADALESALDLGDDTYCVPITTRSSPHQRMSLTLSALAHSQQILLLAFGTEKQAVLNAAQAPNSAYPIARLLHLDRPPIHLFWAP